MIAEGRPCLAVDERALMARLEGDRELLAELMELFVADAEALHRTLANGVAGSDSEAVQRAAHTLKGAVGNFCAPAAVSAALALEIAGRDRDMSAAPALLDRLRIEIDAVCAALREMTRRQDSGFWANAVPPPSVRIRGLTPDS